MVTLDRIRLTGLLRRKPRKRGFFYACRLAGDSSDWPTAGPTAVSSEPLGAVARRGLGCRTGYEPLREAHASTSRGLKATSGVTCRARAATTVTDDPEEPE